MTSNVSDSLEITRSVTIPRDELRFRYVASQGPGGQHVNRSNTQVELIFNLFDSPSLTDIQRTRIMKALGRRISKEGLLQVTSQSTRSQKRNRERAIDRFVELLRGALRVQKKRKPSRPTRGSKERRLKNKKQRSDTKRLRGRVNRSD